jgi:hypothetical protein
MDRSVLLVGTNSKKYLDFAINCAESVRLHNPKLRIFIATNLLPDRKPEGIDFITISDEIAKLYIETKLYLDTFIQTKETLYLDSDMFCYGSLDPIFDCCSKMDVTVLGKAIPLQDWWGADKVDYAKNQFGINQSILFNGGLYYLKKTDLTTKIYEHARHISLKYDEYGFNRIQNNWKNEEDLMAISMIGHQQLPIDDEGLFVAGFSPTDMPSSANVLNGQITYAHGDKLARYRNNLLGIKSPVLFHFGGENMYSSLYISQLALLKLYKMGFPPSIAATMVSLSITLPYKVLHGAKQLYKKYRK